MITEQDRRKISRNAVPEGCIGFDCDGKIIKDKDTIEVVKENEDRRGLPEYKFCSVGKRGKARKHYCFPIGWVVTVKFEAGPEVGCIDYFCRIVPST